MKKIIQIINNGKIFYHVSVNPNNGCLKHSKDTKEASVFISEWDMTFIPRIKEHYKNNYPNCKINIIETDN